MSNQAFAKQPTPVLAAQGRELQALLAPITPQEFVHDYWGKRPLFVKGFPNKYKGLFDADAFRQALTPPGNFPEDFLRASFDTKTAQGTSARPKSAAEATASTFRATVEQAVPLFNAGATLCVTQIELRLPSLGPFLTAIKRQLGYPGKVCFNAYLSPADSGFNWHFDGRIASTLQIEGTKRWRFSKQPAIAWPRGNGVWYADGTAGYADPLRPTQDWERLAPLDLNETEEVLLEPGDLLILPAGVWHEACGGDGGSLALNLTFTPVSYTTLAHELLEELLAREAEWRSPAPLLPRVDAAPGELDPLGVAAIQTQLTRAASALQSLAGDSAEVVKLWRSFVQNPNPGAAAAYTQPVEAAMVEPTQRLRVRDPGQVIAMLAEGGARLCIGVGLSRTFEAEGGARHFVQRVLSEGEFVAGDCVDWSPDRMPVAWGDVQATLTQLAREGLIETVP